MAARDKDLYMNSHQPRYPSYSMINDVLRTSKRNTADVDPEICLRSTSKSIQKAPESAMKQINLKFRYSATWTSLEKSLAAINEESFSNAVNTGGRCGVICRVDSDCTMSIDDNLTPGISSNSTVRQFNNCPPIKIRLDLNLLFAVQMRPMASLLRTKLSPIVLLRSK